MDKKIYQAQDVRDKIISGIDFIADPVKQTLSPKGGNVLYETEHGDQVLTNDGVTIAKNISSKDQIENAVIEIVKESSLRTNMEAGDGTSTTILLCQTLTKEALKLVDSGYSWIEVRDELQKLAEEMIKYLDSTKYKVTDNKSLLEIATISSNNDKKAAKDVMEAIDIAKEDGMIFLEPNNKPETEIVKDLGYMIRSGVMYQELLTNPGQMSVAFENAPVLLTDKKLYYGEEAETILRAAVKEKHKSIVIVARDFMGEALNVFIANHSKGVINVMLVKADIDDKNTTVLQDLAVYLGGKIISEKTGSLVNKISPSDFVMVNKAYSDPAKTLFTPKTTGSKELKERIKMIKDELDKKPDHSELKGRLASLTTGVVTIRVGGSTPTETREKIFRYEDAINATRSAMKYGYLVGGGKALLNVLENVKCKNADFAPLFRKWCQAPIRQIADNCGKHADTVIEKISSGGVNYGYNALTDEYGDLIKAGVIDPFLVLKMAIRNSVSVASVIISIKNFVINDIEEYDEKENKQSRA